MPRASRTTPCVFIVATLAVACVAPKNTIRIAPNPTADSLVFLLRNVADTGRGAETVYGLSVVRCDTKESLWTIAADGSRQIPPLVVYGRPVPGFPTRTGPTTLTAGCYEVLLTGAAARRFEVGAERTIRVLDSVVKQPLRTP